MVFTVVIVYFVSCSVLLQCISGFNVDTVLVDRYTGGVSGSQFGYASTLHTNAQGSWLIVGAPRDNMAGASFLTRPGNVYRCQLLQSSKTCQAFTIRTNENTRQNNQQGYEEDNQFLGGSIVRTTNKIVACAQQWKNLNDAFNLEKPVGRCHEITSDLNTVISTKVFNYNRYYHTNGYSYAMSLIGTVAIPTSVTDQVLIGAPGMWDSKGGFVFYDASRNSGFATTYSANTNNDIYNNFEEGANMGLAVGIGRFGPANGCSVPLVVAGVPHYADVTGHKGSFLILCATGGGSSLVLRKQFTGTKIGSGFGMAICVADVNNDGRDDILVGAPLQEVVSYDEGTVFVYYGTGNSQYVNSAAQNLYGLNQAGGRFGTAIVNIGDISKDGFDDIAIGAPNEDDGAGAVYIFNGKSGQMNSVYSQRISAKVLFAGIKSFGTSITLPMDVDNNQYNDFAVGAFQSDSTFLFRSGSVINTIATTTMIPSTIPLSSNGLACATPENDFPCVTVRICFSFTGTAIPSTTQVRYRLEADVLMKDTGKASRVAFYNTSTSLGTMFTSSPITISRSQNTCNDEYARVLTQSREFFSQITTALNFRGEFWVSQQSSGSTLAPNHNIDLPTTLSGGASFQTDCVGVCNPDLVISLSKENKPIVYGQTVDYSFTVSVRNLGEPAFGGQFIARITTKNANYLGYTVLFDLLSVAVTCQTQIENVNTTVARCDLPNAFYQQQTASVRLRYRVTADVLSNQTTSYNDLLSYVTLSVIGSSGGIDANTADNTRIITQNVQYSADVDISGVTRPEQAVVSAMEDTTLRFSHIYTVINKGPSPLFAAKIQLSLPAVLDNAAVLVGMNAYQVISRDTRSNCSIKLVPGVHVGGPSQMEVQSSGITSQSQAVCSSMLDPKCVIIECRIFTLEVNQQTEMEIVVRLTESVIRIKNIPEFQYYTNATITPTESAFPDSLQVNTTAQISSTVYPSEIVTSETEINLWLIIGSVIGGLVVFILLGVILWKCGFFKREKKEKIDKWKRQSNFYEQRKTQRISRLGTNKPQDDEIVLDF